MNTRLPFAAIVARLVTVINDPATYVGTLYDKDYITNFKTKFPAVWLVGQRLTPFDTGDGYSGQFRQHCRVEVAVRLVLQRYKQNELEIEEPLTALHNAVESALNGWTHPNAESQFAWVSSQDGPPSESLILQDLLFATETSYQRASV